METAGNRATGVHCYDLLEQTERTYRADTIVLAAGTIESAKIALQSGLADPANLIGRGITDHTIRFRHFTVPPHHVHSSTTDSAKAVIQHPAATADAHAFDIVVELGTELNQGRYADPVDLREEVRIRAGWMMCEVVFQYYADLLNQNFVRLASADPVNFVEVHVERATPSPPSSPRPMRSRKACSPPSTPNPCTARPVRPALMDAKLGGVAHEVGTLRMSETDQGVVDQNLQFREYENLYACDNSVLPASAAANPTLTLASLALRLAEHLVRA